MSILNLNDSALLKTQSYINGQWLDASSGDSFAVTDPATGEIISRVADLGASETQQAIAAADQALAAWKNKTAKERSQL